MNNIKLDFIGKKDSQIFIGNLQNTTPEEIDKLIYSYKLGNEPVWHRFIKGAYYHPITWWMGLLQIQMQLGMWGTTRKVQSQIVANQLSQTLSVARSNVDGEILYKALVYNLKHRKADILGRFAGGAFTNYASTGGKLGNKAIPKNTIRTVKLSNFVLATYGAAIKSVASGHKELESIIQSVLTGSSHGPIPYPSVQNYHLSKQELEIFEKAESALDELDDLTRLSPQPVPISEFCLRPENIDLEALCQ